MTISYVEVFGGIDPFGDMRTGLRRAFAISGTKYTYMVDVTTGHVYKIRNSRIKEGKLHQINADWKFMVGMIEERMAKGKLHTERFKQVLEFCRQQEKIALAAAIFLPKV